MSKSCIPTVPPLGYPHPSSFPSHQIYSLPGNICDTIRHAARNKGAGVNADSIELFSVGTLKDGYIRNVPLPRVPRIQSTSEHVASAATATRNSHDTCYLQVPRVPTWSDLVRSLSGLGRRSLRPFSPVWLM